MKFKAKLASETQEFAERTAVDELLPRTKKFKST